MEKVECAVKVKRTLIFEPRAYQTAADCSTTELYPQIIKYGKFTIYTKFNQYLQYSVCQTLFFLLSSPGSACNNSGLTLLLWPSSPSSDCNNSGLTLILWPRSPSSVCNNSGLTLILYSDLLKAQCHNIFIPVFLFC